MNNPHYDQLDLVFMYLKTYRLFLYAAEEFEASLLFFLKWRPSVNASSRMSMSRLGPCQLAPVWISILEGEEKQYGSLQGGCHLPLEVSRDDTDVNKWWGYF